MVEKSTLKFLKDLTSNNNREWFQANKPLYENAHQNMIEFVEALTSEMNKHDEIEPVSGKKALFRIYRDVRFSKEKTPYNPRFAFGLKRATKLKRGGYYVFISPGESFIGCGFFQPNSDDLKRIRQDISWNYKEWNKIISSKKIVADWGELSGETVLSAPRGFEKDHPAIDLLRHKSFIFKHSFTDKEVVSPDFLKEVNRRFRSIRPWFDYMSEILTTDNNGELIV